MEGNNQADSMLMFRQKKCMQKAYWHVLATLYDQPLICVEIWTIFKRNKGICEKGKVPLHLDIIHLKTTSKSFKSGDL